MSYIEIQNNDITPQSGSPKLIVNGQNIVPLWYAIAGAPGEGAGQVGTSWAQQAMKDFAKEGFIS